MMPRETDSAKPGGPVALSIITAAYNAEPTLADMVASVLAQSRGDWELVLVDDGSSDATLETARRFAAGDERIVVFTQPNAGTAAARNHGFAHSSAPRVCFLDADDMLEPDYVSRMLAQAEADPGCDIISCNADYLLRDGTRRPVWAGPHAAGARVVTVEDQLRESSILLMSVVRREMVVRAEGFRSLHSEDYDFWLRALVLGARHCYVPEVLASYRRHEGSKTTSLAAEARSFLRILEDARAMPQLTEGQRAVCDEAIEFAHARIQRRELEEALLRGEYWAARRAYVRSAAAFPDKAKYAVGWLLMMLSPAAYTAIKRKRMI